MPRVPAILREDAPFRLLFAGQALSVVGDRITPVAIAFAVLSIGSPTDLGIVMAALIGLIPQTVAPGRLQAANALLGVTRSVASIAGPAVAGLILAGAGPGEAIA